MRKCMMNENSKENREYFRITGIVYLTINKLANQGTATSPLVTAPEFLDKIALKLLHYKANLNYHQPAHFQSLLEMADILELMHDTYLSRDSHPTIASKRQSVILSGSGMEFLSEEAFNVGDLVSLNIGFPDYPFTSVQIEAEIKISELCPGEARRKTIVSFGTMTELDRNSIIKYVNFLQRKKKIEKKPEA